MPHNSSTEMKEVKVITPSEGSANEGLTFESEEMQVKLKVEAQSEATIEGVAKKFNVKQVS